VVAGDEESASVQVCGERKGFSDRSEREISQVQHDGVRSDNVVPPANQRGIHLRDG